MTAEVCIRDWLIEECCIQCAQAGSLPYSVTFVGAVVSGQPHWATSGFLPVSPTHPPFTSPVCVSVCVCAWPADCYRRTRRLPRATNGLGALSSVALGPTSH